MYEERKYRDLFKGSNLVFFDARIMETDLMIGAERELKCEALESIRKYRRMIEEYIRSHHDFLTSLEPIAASEDAPFIIKSMCEAAAMAGVGPMAAVAGALSEMVGKDLLKLSEEIIVENGGDIFIKTKSTRKAGIYAGDSPLSEKLAIEINPADTPLGICTSSGTVGHSLSFGKADAAVVIAKNAFIADAAATAVGNLVISASDMEKAVQYGSSIPGVTGVVIIIGGAMAAWGNIKLLKL
jgi:ApbE superfamily uncharacterized protein (UPF0280 family)